MKSPHLVRAALTAADKIKASVFSSVVQRFLAAMPRRCRSGEHWHRDPVNRNLCCDGFRPTGFFLTVRGQHKKISTLRTITVDDVRFPWEKKTRRKSATIRLKGEECPEAAHGDDPALRFEFVKTAAPVMQQRTGEFRAVPNAPPPLLFPERGLN